MKKYIYIYIYIYIIIRVYFCIRHVKYHVLMTGKGKGKIHPITGHEDQEGEQRYTSTISLTSAQDGVGWSTPRLRRFTPQERPGTHCIGGWVSPTAGLDGCGKFRHPPHGDSIPGLSGL